MPINPPVTIVVLTRDRADSLERTLNALSHLTYPNYKILVIDNRSIDNTREVANKANTEYIYCSKLGVSMCRQTGIDNTTTPIIAMCDDDCIPVPNWLDHLVTRLLSDDKLALIGGHIINIGFGDDKLYKGRGKLQQNSIISFVEDPREAYYYGSANIALRRDVVASIGGYDPFYRTGGYEEADLITRLISKGYTVGYEPEAIVEHHHVATSFRHNRWFYSNQLLRLYFHLKHRRPASFGEWFRFCLFEANLLLKEIIPNLKGLAVSIVSLHPHQSRPLLIRLFNSLSARLVIPWIYWKIHVRHHYEKKL